MAKAARLNDPIGHSPSMNWLVKGLLIGGAIAVAGVAIAGTGGLAAAAIVGGAAAGGAGIGELMSTMSWAPKEIAGAIVGAGSGNVYINGRPAVRAHLDKVACDKHSGTPPIATGSSKVFINGLPAARVGDKTGCGGDITDGSGNVFIGGETLQTDVIHPEELVPGWVHATLFVVGAAAAAVLAGPVVATLGLVGGLAGGAGGGWLGGRVWGEGSDGQKWAMLGGSLVGGACGAKGGSQINNTVQAAGLIRATHTEAISRIESMSAAKRGPVLTGIRDSITGKIHFGENFDLSKAQGRKAFQDFKKNAHPLVKERIINQEKAIAEGITTPSPRAGTPGAHSEVVALDKAIKARELMTGQKVTEADLSTFKLHNQSMMNAHPASRMNRCDNCAVITDGVTVIGHE